MAPPGQGVAPGPLEWRGLQAERRAAAELSSTNGQTSWCRVSSSSRTSGQSSPSADGVVGRQLTYTVADVAAKVVHGVLLAVIARKVSKAEGYDQALASDVTVPRGGVTDVRCPGGSDTGTAQRPCDGEPGDGERDTETTRQPFGGATHRRGGEGRGCATESGAHRSPAGRRDPRPPMSARSARSALATIQGRLDRGTPRARDATSGGHRGAAVRAGLMPRGVRRGSATSRGSQLLTATALSTGSAVGAPRGVVVPNLGPWT